MSYDRVLLLVVLVGLLAPWSELLGVSGAHPPKRCRRPPKQGKCNLGLLRYYFDVETNTCQTFVYQGCENSANKFLNLQDCLRKCQRFVETAERPGHKGTLPQICTFPKKTGRCKASFHNYYYNTETKKCEEFVYGGCGGNANNFPKIEDCIEKCERFA